MMKQYFFLFTALLMLFAAADSYGQAWRGKGRITGKVKDSSGAPIEGVTIKFSSEKLATSTEVKTDKKGNWTLMGIHGGNWNVDFIKEGFQTEGISAVISEGGYNEPIEIVMSKLEATAAKEASPAQTMSKAIEGQQLMAAKDYTGAIGKFQEALTENPAVYQIYGDIANAYYESGNPDKAIENLKIYLEKEKAAGVTTADQKVITKIAGIYLEKKDIAKAKEYMTMVDESQVADPTVFYNLGVNYYNAQDMDNAIKYFEKSVQVDPKFADGYYQLALVYLAKGNNAKTIEYFNKVIEIDPNSDMAKEAQDYIKTMGQ